METLNEARHQGLRNLIISLDGTPAADTAGGEAGSDGERGLESLGAAAPRVVVSDPATGGRFLGEGSESTVFQDAETGRAIKVRKIPGADSDCVAADRFMAICPDYVVTDFKPGANTFIDEETGEVRFIDPRILRNSPSAGIGCL